MIATSKLTLSDLTRQRHLAVELGETLTPDHTVGQAIDHYLEHTRIPGNGLRWTAFSRGRLLDKKRRLADVPVVDDDWTVMPEVTAGAV